jgi:hypothetical protein
MDQQLQVISPTELSKLGSVVERFNRFEVVYSESKAYYVPRGTIDRQKALLARADMALQAERSPSL